MSFFLVLEIIILAYLVGSIPFGWVFVKLISGRDVRFFASGRTGGTNAMRAAGPIAGLLTGLMDVLKAIAAGWVADTLAPGVEIIKVVAVICAILGHNYSFFLVERDENNRLVFRGGAGGAPALGGAVALWFPSLYYILPISAAIFFFVGYASVTTISISVGALLVFAIRALNGTGPWEHVLYGVISVLIVLWALRPNLKRLVAGNERLTGLRGYLQRRRTDNENPSKSRKGGVPRNRRMFRKLSDS